MREKILNFERLAHHSPSTASLDIFKVSFNQSVAYDLKKLMLRFSNEGKLEHFEKLFVHQGILCTKTQNGKYQAQTIFS